MNAQAMSVSAVTLGAFALISTAAWGSALPGKERAQPEQTSAAGRCRPANPGKTTKDYEVVFGRRSHRVGAYLLMRRVRRSGFKRARIEREDCMYEVAIIFLTKDRAIRIARRALKADWAVRIMQS